MRPHCSEGAILSSVSWPEKRQAGHPPLLLFFVHPESLQRRGRGRERPPPKRRCRVSPRGGVEHRVTHGVPHPPPRLGWVAPVLIYPWREGPETIAPGAADAERRSKTAPRPAALRRCWRWTFAQAPGGTGTIRRCPGRAPAGPVPTGIPAGRNGPLSRSGRPVSPAGPERSGGRRSR